MILLDWLFQSSSLNLPALILLYAGPDQILPLVSVIATIIGVLLIWWQRFVLLMKKTWKFLASRMSSNDKVLAASAKKKA